MGVGFWHLRYFWTLVLGAWCFSPLPSLGQKPADLSPVPALDPIEAKSQGRELAAQLRRQKPAENSSNKGWLKIREDGGVLTEVPAKFQIILTTTNWLSVYETTGSSNRSGPVKLTVVCSENGPNQYWLSDAGSSPRRLAGSQVMIPFAGSDFWLADFGREFLFWPDQRLLRKQVHRSRSCQQLESINPGPTPGGYARVLSWIDTETGGIMDAEAFDVRGATLKRFSVKSFKKVRGQYELEEMEISNRKTGSRTRIEFDLK
jgi:hypothetical protein